MAPSFAVKSMLSGRRRGSKIPGLRGFTTTSFYATAVGGGEAGVNTGFLTAFLFRYDAPNATAQMLGHRTDGTTGRQVYVGAGGSINAEMTDGSSAWKAAPVTAFSQLDMGRLHVCVSHFDATNSKLRLWVDRRQIVDGTAMTGYTAAAVAHAMGNRAAFPASGLTIVGEIDARAATMTQAQMEAFFDQVRTLENLPSTISGATVTKRWSLVDALRGQSIVEGQAAPATLSELVAGGGSDVMTKNGTPTVTQIDTTIDGRKSYGINGMSAGANLQSAVGAGLVGAATGFVRLLDFSIDSQAVASSNRLIASDTTNWDFRTVPFNDALSFATAGGSSPSYTVPTSDLGRRQLAVGVWTGTQAQLYVKGVLVGTSAAGSLSPLTNGRMMIGARADGFGADGVSFFGLGGWDAAGGATLSEVQALFDAYAAAGKIVMPSGKTNAHHYDPSLDIAADPTAVPATILDRIGSDHLTRVGTPATAGSSMIALNGASIIRTAGVSPLAGTAAAGLWAEGVFDLVSADFAGARILMTSGENYTSNGWCFTTWGSSAAPALLISAMDGTTAKFQSVAISPGRRHLAIRLNTTGTADFFIDGVLTWTLTIAAYTPHATAPLSVGASPTINGWQLGGSSCGGVAGAVGGTLPTNAEIAAASTTGRANGKPAGIAGKTSFRWSFPDDVADAGNQLPAILKERVAGAQTMTLLNGGLVVSRRTERSWSYEAGSGPPVMIGARGWSAANYFSSALTAFAHTALPFWFLFPIIIHVKSGSSLNLMGKAAASGQQGFNPYCGTAFASLGMYVGTGSGYSVAPNLTVLDSDLNRPLLMAYQWTGSALQAFAKRARNGGDVTSAFSPFTGNFALGRHPDSPTNPIGDQATLLGFMGGLGNLTLAEYQAASDAFFAEEDLVAVPGKTLRLYSAKKAALANAGALTTMTDQMGSAEALTMIGAPAISNLFAHAA